MPIHRKQLKRVHEPGHFHELTFSCYRRKTVLTNNAWRTELARLLDIALIESQFDLTAFVLMPDHVHLLIYPQPEDPDIGKFLATFKQPFSKYVKEVLVTNNSRFLEQMTVRERPGKTCFRFWQEGGGYDRNIFTPKVVEASMDYLHLNPVRRNLVKRAVDWKWSSARFYLLGEKDEALPMITPPPFELFAGV